ncbi:MAG: siderophore-interacting protein [Cellvibrionaceae bacterium]|nr:siderophore-interacting protein [Cellvibrionaceae bacterium]
MSTRSNRTLTVLKKQLLTANMLRITLGGDNLRGFPAHQESAYIKLMLNPDGTAADRDAIDSGHKPLVRSYTIRHIDSRTQEMTLDMVTHGDQGPAASWALNCTPGSCITINGPGAKKLITTHGDWFFLAGDMTALPAISVNLEQLPQSARGYAVIEVISEQDKQALKLPQAMTVHWVINPHPARPNQGLIDAVTALPWLEGTANVWLACEFDSMRALRHYFTHTRKLERDAIYASSYWKMGESDEGNKAAKKVDLDALKTE